MKFLLIGLLALSLLTSAQAADEALQQAIASPARTTAFVARDSWRHPLETLSFFGIRGLYAV